MNIIQPDFHRIISLSHEGKGGVALLYHPKLTLIDSRTLNLGCVSWAQLKLDSTIISVAAIYAPNDSPRVTTYLWHQLKMELPDGQWILLGDFN